MKTYNPRCESCNEVIEGCEVSFPDNVDDITILVKLSRGYLCETCATPPPPPEDQGN